MTNRSVINFKTETMPRSLKQNEKIRKQKKQLILDTALELFAENGFHATSMSQVAKKAGVSKGLAYNYFESKQDILDEIIKTGFFHQGLRAKYRYLQLPNLDFANE